MKKVWQYLLQNWAIYVFIAILLMVVDISQLVMPTIVEKTIAFIKSSSPYVSIRNNFFLSSSFNPLSPLYIKTGYFTYYRTISIPYWYTTSQYRFQESVIVLQPLITYAFYYFLMAGLIVSVRFWYSSLIRKKALVFVYQLQTDLFDQYLELPDSFFQTHEIGDLMARANNDTVSIRRFLVMGIVAAFDIVFMGGSSLIIMFSKSPELTMTVTIPLLILIFVSRIVGSKIHELYKKIQKAFGEITTRIRETLIGMNVIKTFVRESYYKQLFVNACADYKNMNISLAKLMGVFGPTINLVVTLSVILVYVYGGYLVIHHKLAIETLVAYSMYISMLSWPMMAFGFVVNMYQRALISSNRVDEIMYIPTVKKSQKLALTPTVENISLDIRNLHYAYPDIENSQQILHGISLNIPANSITGITGPTGSGKTTLMNLILRIWEPGIGNIFMNGYDIATLDLDFLHKQFAYVPQISFLFSNTIKENLRFSNPGISEEKMRSYCQIAGLMKDIEQFPQQFDTLIGERGITLSGGQKQRMAIARALIAERPVLILDDCFSAVDPETEEQMINQLKSHLLASKQACIMVSHRVSALSWYHQIAVIRKGTITEQGNHQSLVENKSSYYYKLYQKQYLEGIQRLNHGSV